MEDMDEIVIECSRNQATTSHGNHTWTNQINQIVLNPGDVMSCLGGWISVRNSGDNSIEITDPGNPYATEVIADFDIDYYKTLNGKNVVSFPYHSMEYGSVNGVSNQDSTPYNTLGDLNPEISTGVGVGFRQPCGSADNLDDYRSADNKGLQGQPIITYQKGNLVPMTQATTYWDLESFSQSDFYDKTKNLNILNFYQNQSTDVSPFNPEQSWREPANSGGRMYLMYRQTDGRYKRCKRKIPIKIPCGYYSPTNLATFITEAIQEKYYNQPTQSTASYETPDRSGFLAPNMEVTETFNNSGRYYNGMTPIALPTLNGQNGAWIMDEYVTSAGTQRMGNLVNLSNPGFADQTQATYGFVKTYQIAATGWEYQGGADILADITGTNLTSAHWYSLKGTYQPRTSQEFLELYYLMQVSNKYSGLGSNWAKSAFSTANYGGMVDNTPAGNKPPISDMDPTSNWGTQSTNTDGTPSAYWGFPCGIDGQTWNGSALMYIYGVMIANNAQPMGASSNSRCIDWDSSTWDYITAPYGTFNFRNMFFFMSDTTDTNLATAGGGAPTGVGNVYITFSMGGFFSTGVAGYPTGFRDLISYNCAVPQQIPIFLGNHYDITPTAPVTPPGQQVPGPVSPFAWLPFKNNGLMLGDAVSLQPPNQTTAADAPYRIDYEYGPSYIGNTSTNHNRWSLLNWNEPPAVTDADDPQLMPILRKYPNFMEKGMLTNTYTEDYANQKVVPLDIDFDYSTFEFEPMTQTDKVIVENFKGSGDYGNARVEPFYEFWKAQVTDGLIDIEEGQFVDTGKQLFTALGATNLIEEQLGRTYFYAYIHTTIYTSTTTATNYVDVMTNGSDVAFAYRPRGVLVYVDYETFVNQSTYEWVGGDGLKYAFMKGTLFCNNNGGGANVYQLNWLMASWIVDKSGLGIKQNGVASNKSGWVTGQSNYGYQDMFIAVGGQVLDDTGTDNTIVGTAKNSRDIFLAAHADGQFLFGAGYSYRKMGWKNQTAMLATTQSKTDEITNFMYDPQFTRQDVNWSPSVYSQLQELHPAAKSWEDMMALGTKGLPCGNMHFNPRCWIGARSPTLAFDGDTSRFFWAQLYMPNQVANSWLQGTDNGETNANLRGSVEVPQRTPANQSGYGWSDDGADPPGDDTASFTIPINEDAGTDCINYNTNVWNDQPSGIFQGAVELPLHDNIDWFNVNLIRANNGFSKNWTEGGVYPTLDDFTSDFFMFDADARANSWGVVTTTWDHADGYDPTTNRVQIDENYMDPPIIYPSGTWGGLSGDAAWLQQTSWGMFQRPDPTLVYAEMAGICMYWEELTTENFDDTIWATMGFTYADFHPTYFIGMNQQRNFNHTFITDPADETTGRYDTKFEVQSYPLTTAADLTSTGFVSINTSYIGAKQYKIVYPKEYITSAVNIMGTQPNYQLIQTCKGGTGLGGTGLLAMDINAFYEENYNPGGPSVLNQQLTDNNFYIVATTADYFGTFSYASGVPTKISTPFYLIRSSFPDDNGKYLNNATNNTIMPIVAVINLQYGATTDFFWSLDASTLQFTTNRTRVLNEIDIVITNNMGIPATTIEDQSTIFFKVTRNPQIQPIEDNDLRDDPARLEDALNKKQKDLLTKEVKDMIDLEELD